MYSLGTSTYRSPTIRRVAYEFRLIFLLWPSTKKTFHDSISGQGAVAVHLVARITLLLLPRTLHTDGSSNGLDRSSGRLASLLLTNPVACTAPNSLHDSAPLIIRKIRHIHWVLRKLSGYLTISYLNH